MKWLRAFAPVAVALVFAWLVSGHGSCGMPPALQLIQVLDAAPRDIEPGDRFDILGTGFPAGKRAHVTFRGVLRRPGERPQEGATVTVWGVAVTAQRVEIGFDEATESLFCGAGDRVQHTTFEGEIEVAFAAADLGAPPIAGTMQSVTLDLRPPSAGADRDMEGEQALSFLGLHIGPESGAAGLAMASVDTGSRAEAAGIIAGDVLLAFDGLEVAAPSDAIPFPGELSAALRFRRPGVSQEFVRVVSVDGLRRAPPAELIGSGLFIVLALAIVLLFCAPTPGRVATLLAQAASRSRQRLAGTDTAASRRKAPQAALSQALSMVARDVLPPVGLPALADAAAYAALAVMPLGQYVIAARLDVGILFLAAATATVVAALVSGAPGFRPVVGALQIAFQHVPAAVAVAAVVLMTGSLRVQEIERAQGGFPWDWLAFRNPGALFSLLLLLSATRLDFPLGRPASRLSSLVFDRAPSTPLEERSFLRAAIRAHRVLIAGLATVLFLGGWALPGLSPAQQDAHPAFQLLGAFWLLAKTSALVVVLAWSRWALPAPPIAERTRQTALHLVPLAAAALAMTFVWARLRPARSEQLLVSGSLVALAVLLVVAVGQRMRHGLLAPGGDRRLSPFL